MADKIVVRGAREHNLRNISIELPRDKLIVLTGLSGSGKSSLAFGTLYAEAQRRYLESVSPYARRLFDQMAVPDVDDIQGLPPAVALQQQRGAPTSRSSVGSVTTLSNLLRMLYSRAGSYPAKQPELHAEDFSPNTPTGELEVIGLPDRGSDCVSCTYCPRFSVIDHGVFAVPAGTLGPAAMFDLGRIVTVVLSTAATMLCDGPPTLIGIPIEALSHALTAM